MNAKRIHKENFSVEGKNCELQVFQDGSEVIVQAFQGNVPKSHQFSMYISPIDEIRKPKNWPGESVDMLKTRAKRFVEECNRLGIKRFMLNSDSFPNPADARG